MFFGYLSRLTERLGPLRVSGRLRLNPRGIGLNESPKIRLKRLNIRGLMQAHSLNDVIAISEQTSGATDEITDFIKAWLRQHHKGIQDSARTIQLSVAEDYLWPLLQVISKQTQLSLAPDGQENCSGCTRARAKRLPAIVSCMRLAAASRHEVF
jgi:hypothetical protein